MPRQNNRNGKTTKRPVIESSFRKDEVMRPTGYILFFRGPDVPSRSDVFERAGFSLVHNGPFKERTGTVQMDRRVFASDFGEVHIEFGDADRGILFTKAKALAEDQKQWLPLLAVQQIFIRISVQTTDTASEAQMNILRNAAFEMVEEVSFLGRFDLVYNDSTDTFSPIASWLDEHALSYDMAAAALEEIENDAPIDLTDWDSMPEPGEEADILTLTRPVANTATAGRTIFEDPDSFEIGQNHDFFETGDGTVEDLERIRALKEALAHDPEEEDAANRKAHNARMIRAAAMASYCAMVVLPRTAAAGQFSHLASVFWGAL